MFFCTFINIIPSAAAGPEIPGLVPEPREISSPGGKAELAQIVDLVTKNIPSPQLETVGEILTAAGISISPGTKNFVVEARVENASGLNMSKVPETAYDEYYELELRGNKALIRAAGVAGVLWGIRALTGIYRAASMGTEIPNLSIRDWPDLPNRGIFVEDKWGPDRMTLSDWCLVIDRMAALKMNRMGIGVYGCWGSCRYEGQPTEFLMVPVPGHPELKTEKKLKWYSPKDAKWHKETYLPPIFAEDLFGKIVAYGEKKGVTVIPFVNSFGHNTMIPRVMPEVSAKDENGDPVGIGYCLSSAKTREFIESFYGSIVERYYPNGADFFHVQLDEVWPDFPDPDDPSRRADPWCHCAECSALEREDILQDYVLWLVKMLTQKGVKKVVMWNDQLTRHMDALDNTFVQKMKDEGLMDRLILHWWWYSNDKLHDKTRVYLGKQVGIAGWVAPMTCYYNWQMYCNKYPNIELMMKMAHDEGAEGAVSYSVHDPGWTDQEMLMASYAWDFDAVTSREDQRKKWAKGRFGSDAPQFLTALEALQKAASAYPALQSTYYYPYSYCRADVPFPRDYPGEVLKKLAGMGADASQQLQDASATAYEAAKGFTEIAEVKGRDANDEACITSLLGEAARIGGLAVAFDFLVSAYKAVSEKNVDDDVIAALESARESLVSAMEVMEVNKPEWVVPASLQALSVLLEFLDQLKGDLADLKAGKLKPEDVHWTQAGS